MNSHYYEICKVLAPYFSVCGVKSIKNLIQTTQFMDEDDHEEWIPIQMFSDFKKVKSLGIHLQDIIASIDWQILHKCEVPEYLPLIVWNEPRTKVKAIRYYDISKTKTSSVNKSISSSPAMSMKTEDDNEENNVNRQKNQDFLKVMEPVFEHGIFTCGFPMDATEHEVALFFSSFGVVKSIEKFVNEEFRTGHGVEGDIFDAMEPSGFLIQFELPQTLVKVLSSSQISYESSRINVSICKLPSVRKTSLKSLQYKTTQVDALKYAKDRILRMFTIKEINPLLLKKEISKLASVSSIDTSATFGGMSESSWVGPVYVKLKASNASQLARLINREGGIQIGTFSLKNVCALEGEEERLYWLCSKTCEEEAKWNTPTKGLTMSQAEAVSFLPLVNKHGHKRSTRSLRRSAAKGRGKVRFPRRSNSLTTSGFEIETRPISGSVDEDSNVSNTGSKRKFQENPQHSSSSTNHKRSIVYSRTKRVKVKQQSDKILSNLLGELNDFKF